MMPLLPPNERRRTPNARFLDSAMSWSRQTSTRACVAPSKRLEETGISPISPVFGAKKFLFALRTKMTDPLPEGWILRVSSSKGKVFYYNTKTQQTQWTRPTQDPSKGGGNNGSALEVESELEPPRLAKKPKRDDDPITTNEDKVNTNTVPTTNDRAKAIVRCIRVGASDARSNRPFEPWPHQVDAVAKALDALDDPKPSSGARKFLFQHSTGSGKTVTIGAIAHQLLYHRDHRGHQFHTIVLLIDRVKLDEQVGDSVESFLRRNGFDDVYRATSIEHLATLLTPTDAMQHAVSPQRVIITTIQKLGLLAKNKVLLVRLLHGTSSDTTSRFSRVAIITDEAHRSHTSSTRDIIQVIMDHDQTEGGSIIFLGFTATPNTEALELFGCQRKGGELTPFHCYSMAQAVADQRIVDVLQSYESVRCHIDTSIPHDTKSCLVRHRLMRGVLDVASADVDILKAKASFIASHFQKMKTSWRRAKCMIVTRSRQDVVRYYQLMANFVRNTQATWQVFAVFSGTVTLEEGDSTTSVTEQSLNAKHATLASSDVVIVCDKLDTGYSDPMLAGMYVDRYLRSSVQTVQLFSRLNRKHCDKHTVQIVDFANHAAQIRRHFATFWNDATASRDGQGALSPVAEVRTAVAVLSDEFQPWRGGRTESKRLLELAEVATNVLDRDGFQQVQDAVRCGLKAWCRLEASGLLDEVEASALMTRRHASDIREGIERACATPGDEADLDVNDIIKRMKARVARLEVLHNGPIDPSLLLDAVDPGQDAHCEKAPDVLSGFERELRRVASLSVCLELDKHTESPTNQNRLKRHTEELRRVSH